MSEHPRNGSPLPSDSATGDSATGDSATGDSATGDSATGDSATGDGVRVLRGLVDELRRAPAPELDWERAEARLLSAIESERRSAVGRRGQGSAWRHVGVFAAAAAALVLLLSTQSERETTRVVATTDMVAIDPATLPAAHEHGALPTYQVDKMTPRSVVMSGDEPMRFSLAGVATWVLAPHSSVIVATTSSPHVLELQRGTVSAEVVPRHDSDELVESFVIEAGTTRVAVHGTVFSVSREGDELTVDVTRGSVTVGPAGYRGATSGHLLIGPARASFSLREARLARIHPRSSKASTPSTQRSADEALPARVSADDQAADDQTAAHEAKPSAPVAKRDDAASDDAARSEPDPGQEPVITTAPLTNSSAHAIVASCLAASAARGEGTSARLLISSRVTAVPDSGGKVMAVRFSPPLRPDLQERCGGALFGREVGGGGNLSFSVNVTPP